MGVPVSLIFCFTSYFLGGHSFSTYAKFSEKTNISYPLIRTRTCAYKGVRITSFLENFAYVLNE